MKLMTEQKELPSDVVALSLYYLTAYHWNEVVRGFCGKGIYTLKTEYRKFAMREEDCQLRQTLTVEEISKLINKKATSGDSLIGPAQPTLVQSPAGTVITAPSIPQSASLSSIYAPDSHELPPRWCPRSPSSSLYASADAISATLIQNEYFF